MKYLIEESELRDLLYAYNKLAALECGGVDNWEWYGGAVYDYLEEFKEEERIENDDFDLEDMVEVILQEYEPVDKGRIDDAG